MDEAAAIEARGKAAADVVRFDNEADSAGWKKAVEAFDGDGKSYAQYVMFQKLSPAYKRIMVNTADSPIMKIFESFSDTSSADKSPIPLLPQQVPTESVPATTVTPQPELEKTPAEPVPAKPPVESKEQVPAETPPPKETPEQVTPEQVTPEPVTPDPVTPDPVTPTEATPPAEAAPETE